MRIEQGFGVADTWVANVLGGRAATGTASIDGIEWDVYELDGTANLRYALATEAGTDTVVVYGSMTADTAEIAARGIADQIRTLREETP